MKRVSPSLSVKAFACWVLIIAAVCTLQSDLSRVAYGQDAASSMVYPIAVAVGADDAIYVVDLKLPGAWKVDSGKATVLVQGSKRFKTPLNAVRCAAWGKQGLLLGDSAATGVFSIVDGKPKKVHSGRIGIPTAIAVTSAGDILVADLDLHRIWKIAAEGGAPSEFARVRAPRGMAVDAQGRVWVVSHGQDQVLRLSPDGKTREVIVSGRAFRFPHQIAVNSAGEAFVSDGYAKAIWKIPAEGKPAKLTQGGPLKNPVGIALHGEDVLVADPHAKALFRVNAKGEVSQVAGPQ